MKQVTIWIEGGVIQNMNVPEGVTVVTYDFDIDGAPEDELSYHDGYLQQPSCRRIILL